MARLLLELMGPFRASVEGKEVRGLAPAKCRALLAYVMVEPGGVQRRDALAELLWPDVAPGAALTSLRQCLFRVRSALEASGCGPVLAVTRSTVHVLPDAEVQVDVREFDAGLRRVRGHHPTGGPPCDACRSLLEPAVGLHRGPFLDDLHVTDSERFDDWVIVWQESLHEQLLVALDLLGATAEATGRLAEAADYARREIELDPCRETATRRRMRALASMGETAQAVREFERCRRALAKDWHLRPSIETLQLLERIRAGDLLPAAALAVAADPQSALHPRSSVPRPTEVVGRDRELAAFERHLRSALRGHGNVLFVVGEAGAGKTTLVAEFLRSALAAAPDLLVAWGDGAAHRSAPRVMEEALHTLAGSSRIALGDGFDGAGLALRQRAARSDLLEAIRSTRNEEPAGVDAHAGPVIEDIRGAGAHMPELLRQLSLRRPLVVVVDDLQWADAATIGSFRELGRTISRSRILLVGAYRPEAVSSRVGEGGHDVYEAVTEVCFGPDTEVVDLDACDPRAFVDALLDREPNDLDGSFREALADAAGGNPLVTGELVAEWRHRGVLDRDDVGLWHAACPVDWSDVPARVRAVAAHRLEGLTADERLVLDAACVQGDSFVCEIAADAAGMPANTTLWQLCDGLSRRHRLTRPVEQISDAVGGLSRHRFRNGLVRRHLYDRLDPVRRATLHAATARALETRARADPARVIPEAAPASVALHYVRAGMSRQAASCELAAGHGAIAAGDYESAAARYRRGLELVADTSEAIELRRVELELLLGLLAALRAVKGHGDPELARLSGRAMELEESVGDPELEVVRLWLLGRYLFFRGDGRRLARLGVRLIADGTGDRAPERALAGEAALAAALLVRGDFVGALAHVARFRDGVDGPGAAAFSGPLTRQARPAAACIEAAALWFVGRPDRALAVSAAALEEARLAGDPHGLAVALGAGDCVVRALRREWRDVAVGAAQLHELASAGGLATWAAWARVFAGWATVEHGLVAEGLRDLAEGLERYRASGQRWALTLLELALAQARWSAADPDGGLQAVDEAFAVLAETDERFVEAELHRVRGELIALRAADRCAGGEGSAELAVAEGHVRRACLVARRQGARSLELRAALALSRLWALRPGRPSECPTLRAVFETFGEGHGTPDLMEARMVLEGAGTQR